MYANEWCLTVDNAKSFETVIWGCILFVEKFLDTVYLSTDLFSNDISMTYISYSLDSKADFDIMYDIREFKRERKEY